MNIPADYRPLDPAARRRQLEGGTAPSKRVPDAASTPAATGSDAFVAPDSAAVARYTAQVQAQSTDPAKLAALRQAIDDGSYTATPEELVDPLLDRLDPPRQG